MTGASSGIGKELCVQLSSLGAKVILSARSEDVLESIRKGLSHPERSKVLHLDLADKASVGNAAAKCKELFGRIDILMNSGGVSSRSTFLCFEEKSARKLMETNFFRTVSLTKEVIKIMLEQQEGGRIVNIASIVGKFAFAYGHYYSASKFALIGLMDSLRYELANTNIQITNVCPGPVKTNNSINALTADGSKFGKTDRVVAEGMPVKHCVMLILVATCNGVREAWISQQPSLFATYLAQYFPSFLHVLLKKKASENYVPDFLAIENIESKKMHDY